MKTAKFIAHMGYSKFEKGNTLASFSAAGAIPDFYGIETDVHVTNDGHFIAIHDADTRRATNGRVNLNVEESDFETVRSVRLPDYDGVTDRNDIRIPEMKEYFKICKKYGKVAVCELKQTFTKEQIGEILKQVGEMEMLDNTIFISFVPENLIFVKTLAPKQNVQLLLSDYTDGCLDIPLKYGMGVDVFYKKFTVDRIAECVKKGLEVNVYTVDDEAIAAALIKAGAKYITSNCLYKV